MKKEKIGILFFLLGLMFVFGGIGYSEISESWTEFWVGIGEAVIGMIFLILFLLRVIASRFVQKPSPPFPEGSRYRSILPVAPRRAVL